MLYTVIEDCSPFYVRFTHLGADLVIQQAIDTLKGVELVKSPSVAWPHNTHMGFIHHRPSAEACRALHNLIPMNQQLALNPNRAAMFITAPGYHYGVHRDGVDCYSINYHVKIQDNDCRSNWYSHTDCQNYSIDPVIAKLHNAWELKNFDYDLHKPVKTMTAVQGECCLFNTEFFHDFNNSKSANIRIVMTLRDQNPAEVTFLQARQRLFGY